MKEFEEFKELQEFEERKGVWAKRRRGDPATLSAPHAILFDSLGFDLGYYEPLRRPFALSPFRPFARSLPRPFA